MKFFALLILLLSILCTPAKAQETGDGVWHDRYAEGAKQARENGKLLMVVFTGTDWIDICKIFYDEILSHPEFITAVKDKFELIKLEYPEDNKLPRETASELSLLRDAYRVRGFPTVILTSAQGAPFAISGYIPTTPVEYAALKLSMEQLYRERLAELERAETLQGIEKAQALSKGIPELPGTLAARYYEKEIDALIEADPDDTLGMTKKYQRMLADVEYSKLMQLLAKDVQWGKMIAVTENYIDEWKLEGSSLQKALLNKAGVQEKQGNIEGMAKTLLDIVDVDSETGYAEEAQARLDKLRVQNLQQQLAQ